MLARLQEEVRQQKIFGKKPDRPLSYLLNRYYDEISPSKKRSKDDFYTCKLLLRYFGDVMISEISPAKINDYKKKRQQEGLTASAINRPLSLLSHAFNVAVKQWEICDTNPVAKVKRQKENKRLRYLTQDEAARLVEQCGGHLKPIVEWALATGMRRGEILALNWGDIDRTRKYIYIRDSKNSRPRALPLIKKHDTILAQLIQHISGTVFHYQGRPIKSLKGSFGKAVKRAGLEDVTFHTLRHTYASWAVMSGMPLNELMEILGHSSINMVLRYAHLSPEHLRKGMEQVEAH